MVTTLTEEVGDRQRDRNTDVKPVRKLAGGVAQMAPMDYVLWSCRVETE